MTWMIYKNTRPRKSFKPEALLAYVQYPKTLSAEKKVSLMLWFYLLFIFVLFVSAKIFSQPFHIWYIAPLVLAPYSQKKYWYIAVASAFLMILLDMTPFIRVPNTFLIGGKVEPALVRDVFRFIPMFGMMYLAVIELKKLAATKARTLD